MPTPNFDSELTAYFIEYSSNVGLTQYGVFFDYSENNGIVALNAMFSQNSKNKGGVYGDAIFNDNSINEGIVYGNAYVASTATVPASSVTGTITLI
jgi:hypothetical protein